MPRPGVLFQYGTKREKENQETHTAARRNATPEYFQTPIRILDEPNKRLK